MRRRSLTAASWSSPRLRFWGGWLFIPAGIAYLVRDLRDPLGGDADARVPGLESVMGVVGAIAGWISLAVITADRLAASSRVTLVQGPDGSAVVSGTLADLAAAGMPTDRPTTVIAITGLVLGLMIIAAVAHDRTGER